MERKYQCELGIMALGILSLVIIALAILALGKLSCSPKTDIFKRRNLTSKCKGKEVELKTYMYEKNRISRDIQN